MPSWSFYLILFTFSSFVLANVVSAKVSTAILTEDVLTENESATNLPFCDKCIFNQTMLFEKLFEQSDLNGDSLISRQEYLLHAEELFNFLDQDNDGALDENEFNNKMRLKDHQRLNNRYINKNTLANLYLLNKGRAEKSKFPTSIDKNADGLISYAEYMEHALHNFLKLDTNNNRYLSLEEFTKSYFPIKFKLKN